MKNKKYMSEEFYKLLESVIKECEQHPFATTSPFGGADGWVYRVSKKNLGAWENEQKEAIDFGADVRINELCNASHLDCQVYCDNGGYMYLVFA